MLPTPLPLMAAEAPSRLQSHEGRDAEPLPLGEGEDDQYATVTIPTGSNQLAFLRFSSFVTRQAERRADAATSDRGSVSERRHIAVWGRDRSRHGSVL